MSVIPTDYINHRYSLALKLAKWCMQSKINNCLFYDIHLGYKYGYDVVKQLPYLTKDVNFIDDIGWNSTRFSTFLSNLRKKVHYIPDSLIGMVATGSMNASLQDKFDTRLKNRLLNVLLTYGYDYTIIDDTHYIIYRLPRECENG